MAIAQQTCLVEYICIRTAVITINGVITRTDSPASCELPDTLQIPAILLTIQATLFQRITAFELDITLILTLELFEL